MASYIPILKGKEGEFAALEELDGNTRAAIVPLIEIPGIPYDYTNERPAKTLEQHVAGIAERLRRCWQDQPLYLDLPWFGDDEDAAQGEIAFRSALEDCQRFGVRAVPVIYRTTSPQSLTAAAGYSQESQTGACIRLLVEDFEEDVDLEAELDALLDALGAASGDSIDLLLDLKDLNYETSRAVLVARSIFSMVPRRETWRTMILGAASFPEDLSDVNASAESLLPRREWQLWKTLQKKPTALPRRDLIYADYAIAHPIPRELDPRTIRMSANIRYTSEENWLILKGRNVRQYGFDQYFDLCQTLVQRPEYSGAEFSWGDRYIWECAARNSGPGNATTWRKVGTNHHMTLVSRALATLQL